MTDKPIYSCGQQEPQLVYAFKGEVAGLRSEIANLKSAFKAEIDRLNARIQADSQLIHEQANEIDRLRIDLSDAVKLLEKWRK